MLMKPKVISSEMAGGVKNRANLVGWTMKRGSKKAMRSEMEEVIMLTAIFFFLARDLKVLVIIRSGCATHKL